MSDLWEYLARLSRSQLDEIIAMSVSKMRQTILEQELEQSIRKLFKAFVDNKIETDLIGITREYELDQEWTIEMIKNFIVRQNNNKGKFGV